MVLTNFECWAHSGSTADISFSSLNQRRSVDLFNPNIVQSSNNSEFNEHNNKIENTIMMMQTTQTMKNNCELQSSSVTNHISKNGDVQSFKNVSHLSSNGYYGFSQICNESSSSTNNEIHHETLNRRDEIMMINEPESNLFQHQQQSAMNADCITSLLSSSVSVSDDRNNGGRKIAHGNGQQQMDVESQFMVNGCSGATNGDYINKFSRNLHCRKRSFFVDQEDNFYNSSKRFRTCGQQYSSQNQGNSFSLMDHDDIENFSSTNESALLTPTAPMVDHHQQLSSLSRFIDPPSITMMSPIAAASESCASFKKHCLPHTLMEINTNHNIPLQTSHSTNKILKELNQCEIKKSVIKHSTNLFQIDNNKCNTELLKIKLEIKNCDTIKNKEKIINNHDKSYNIQENNFMNDNEINTEDLLFSIHGVSNHLLLRHYDEI